MGDVAYNAVFTATEVAHRTARNGRPYIRARGVLNSRDRAMVRTVMAHGRGYDELAGVLRAGVPVKLRGFYNRVIRDGVEGGEYFAPFQLIKVYDAEARQVAPKGAADVDPSLVEMRGRKGHYRRQRHGPARSLVKMIWVEAHEFRHVRKD